MEEINILWVDDEIDLLKPHFLFLKDRGYESTPCTNGQDALDLIRKQSFDIVLLDENMPGISGLEALTIISEKGINVPVIMITNNQEEYTLNQALSNSVVDFLFKPIHPNQVYASVKKVLEQKLITNDKKQADFLSSHLKISEAIYEANSIDDFYRLYQSLVAWQIQFENSHNK